MMWKTAFSVIKMIFTCSWLYKSCQIGSSRSSSLLLQLPTQHFLLISFLSAILLKFHALIMPYIPPLKIWFALWVRVNMGPECYLIVPMQLNYDPFLIFQSFIVQSSETETKISFSGTNDKSLTPSWWAWVEFNGPIYLYSDDLIVWREFYFSYFPVFFSSMLGPSLIPLTSRSFWIFSIKFLIPRDCKILKYPI